jgi:hypothetical protein
MYMCISTRCIIIFIFGSSELDCTDLIFTGIFPALPVCATPQRSISLVSNRHDGRHGIGFLRPSWVRIYVFSFSSSASVTGTKSFSPMMMMNKSETSATRRLFQCTGFGCYQNDISSKFEAYKLPSRNSAEQMQNTHCVFATGKPLLQCHKVAVVAFANCLMQPPACNCDVEHA